jgi:hypothetical protein
MKTDVIFLGAGASLSAGFPTNKDLTNYIIYKMSETTRFLPYENRTVVKLDLPKELASDGWENLKASLRKSAFLSVDEFCQLANRDPAIVARMKRLLRVALFDHTLDWFLNNDYRTFVESLFLKPASTELNSRFTVVNFNYDGLLGKLLTDAVSERCALAGTEPPTETKLAGLAGGYYAKPKAGLYTPAYESDILKEDEFAHHMPHGTLVAVADSKNIYSLSDTIYGHDTAEKRVEVFLNSYWLDSLIHFPWEAGGRQDVYKRQNDHAAISIREAKRIHFIGLSGHPLLRTSICRMFAGTSLSELLSKEWHIATPDDKWQTFLNIAEGFLINRANDTAGRQQFLSDANRRLRKYDSFAHWLRESPHQKP